MPVAIVTGAGSGIGAATAKALSERGDKVVCADLKLDAAKQTAGGLSDAIAVEVDVSSSASCDRMIEQALRDGDLYKLLLDQMEEGNLYRGLRSPDSVLERRRGADYRLLRA